ncbi:MAG TPA: SLBB domain-containing protein [Fimbriimonadales bacterium]|nr:SLBB domain-containing protein [Fimbriimonadales bacterium]
MRKIAIGLSGFLFFGTIPPPIITVQGEVENPGVYMTSNSTNLRNIIQKSGGLKPDADPKKIEIHTSDGEIKVVDLTKPTPLPTLKPGDVVIVPELDESAYISIEGGVLWRGKMNYSENLTVLRAIQQAKPLDRCDLERVAVTRTNDDGKEEVFVVNLRNVLEGKAKDMPLQPADKVNVPFVKASSLSDRELLTILVIGLLILLLVD